MTTQTVTIPAAPALVTRPNVELMQAGTWQLASGEATFTPDDLRAAVTALDCPAVRNPVLKLGHTDPRFDGEPAVGWVADLAVTDAGGTLVGDYTGMPAWLGEVLASAYPDRSIEGSWDFKCQLGHIHPFVVTAVALLGVVAPGIGTLESLQDVASLYGVAAASDPRRGIPVAVLIHAAGGDHVPKPAGAVRAAVSAEDIRRAFYASPLGAGYTTWVEEIQVDPMQLIVMDDASGDRKRIPYAVAPGGQGEDAVTFGEPVRVFVAYEDAPAPAPAAASAVELHPVRYRTRDESVAGLDRPPAVAAAIGSHSTATDDGAWDGPAQKANLPNDAGKATYRKAYAWVDGTGDPNTKAAYKFIHHEVSADGTVGAANTTACSAGIAVLNGGRGGTTIPAGDKKGVYNHLAKHLKDAGMTPPELAAAAPSGPGRKDHTEGAGSMDWAKIKGALGLDPEATDEEARTALAAALAGHDHEDEDEGDEATAPRRRAAAAGPATGVMVIDRAAWDEREDRIKTLEAHAAKASRAERDDVIMVAIRDGKFPPARREHWTRLWDADPEGTREVIASLARNVMPTELAGYPGTLEDDMDEEFAQLFPPEAPVRERGR